MFPAVEALSDCDASCSLLARSCALKVGQRELYVHWEWRRPRITMREKKQSHWSRRKRRRVCATCSRAQG